MNEVKATGGGAPDAKVVASWETDPGEGRCPWCGEEHSGVRTASIAGEAGVRATVASAYSCPSGHAWTVEAAFAYESGLGTGEVDSRTCHTCGERAEGELTGQWEDSDGDQSIEAVMLRERWKCPSCGDAWESLGWYGFDSARVVR